MCNCSYTPFWQYIDQSIRIWDHNDVNHAIKNQNFRGINLCWRNSEISNFDIARVLKSPSITTAYINGIDLTEIKMILDNPGIRHIWLQNNKVSLDVVSEIVKSNTTRSLAIGFRPDAIKLISQMTSLDILLFGVGRVEKPVAMDICKIQNLKCLDLKYVDMQNDVAQYILENTTAQVVNIKLRDTNPNDSLIEKIYTWLEKLVNKTARYPRINYIAVRLLSLISPHISISHFQQYKFTRPWPLTVNVVSNINSTETFKNPLYAERQGHVMFMLNKIFPSVISDLVFSYDF